MGSSPSHTADSHGSSGQGGVILDAPFDSDRELLVHEHDYLGFVGLIKWGAIFVAIIVACVIWAVSHLATR